VTFILCHIQSVRAICRLLLVLKCCVSLIWLCCFVCSHNPQLLIVFTMKNVCMCVCVCVCVCVCNGTMNINFEKIVSCFG